MQEVLGGDGVLMAHDTLRELFGSIHIVEDENGLWAEIAANQTVMLKAAGLPMGLVVKTGFESTTFAGFSRTM